MPLSSHEFVKLSRPKSETQWIGDFFYPKVPVDELSQNHYDMLFPSDPGELDINSWDKPSYEIMAFPSFDEYEETDVFIKSSWDGTGRWAHFKSECFQNEAIWNQRWCVKCHFWLCDGCVSRKYKKDLNHWDAAWQLSQPKPKVKCKSKRKVKKSRANLDAAEAEVAVVVADADA